MNKLVSVLVAGLLAFTILAGCGPTPTVSGDPHRKPKDAPGAPGSDPAAKLKDSPKTAGDTTLANAVTSPEELVAGLPADARPRDTSDTIRLDRANDWLKANAPGKRIAWDYALGDVTLERIGESRN